MPSKKQQPLKPAVRGVAKKSGPKKNQKRGAAPSENRKESVHDRSERLRKNASNIALSLVSSVNYEAPSADASETSAAKRSHKRQRNESAQTATGYSIYRFIGKEWGAAAHDDVDNTVKWRQVQKKCPGVSCHKQAKKLYADYAKTRQVDSDDEPKPWGDNDPRCRFLDLVRLRELWLKAHDGIQHQGKLDYEAWEIEIDAARLRMIQEDGKPNVTMATLNQFSPKPDARTIGALIFWLAPETAPAAPLAAGRFDAKNEARNMITLAAVAKAEFIGTAPDVTFSTDMFTVFISEKGEVKVVYMASGSLAVLKEHNLKAAIADNAKGIAAAAKQRASIPCYATFSATGELLSAVLLFVDSNIPTPKKHRGYYHVYPISGNCTKGKAAVVNSNIFVAMLPVTFNENIVLHQIWSQIILPKTVHVCKELALATLDYGSIGSPSRSRSTSVSTRTRAQRAANLSSDSQRSLDNGDNAAATTIISQNIQSPLQSPLRHEVPVQPLTLEQVCHLELSVVSSQFTSPIHCMDGDCPQIAVLMDRDKMKALDLLCIQDVCQEKFPLYRWRFIKFAAGCSMIQSPNDVSHAHSQVKRDTGVKAEFRSKDWEPAAEETDAMMRLFQKIVMRSGVGCGVDKGRDRAIMGYISNARKIYSRAFNAVNCCQGWRLAGLCPYDPEIIMSKWSGWAAMPKEHGDLILSQIDELAEIIRKDGRIDDAELSRRFPFLPEPHVEGLAAKSWVRDRAVVISCQGYGSARAAAEPLKTAAKAAAKEKAAAARASAPAAIVPYSNICDHLPKHVIVAQLKARKIAFKASDKVDALLKNWKEFDENLEAMRLVSWAPVPSPAAAVVGSVAADFSRRTSPRSQLPAVRTRSPVPPLPPRPRSASPLARALSPLRSSAGGGASAASTVPAVSGIVLGSWTRVA
jgi:hypothetical protein